MQAEKSSPKVNVKMLGHKFQMTINMGATINVIDRKTFQQLENVTLRNTNTQAYAYSKKTPVDFLGKFETIIETKPRYTVGVFYVVNEYDSGCLLSSQTTQELSLISLHLNKIKSTPNMVNKTIKDAKLSQLLSKHKEVFTGLGKLKGHMVKLNIDKEITPTAQPQRRIPFHIREKVGEALKELCRYQFDRKVKELSSLYRRPTDTMGIPHRSRTEKRWQPWCGYVLTCV